jgi:tetratricopeptide (TPR) repeat protein
MKERPLDAVDALRPALATADTLAADQAAFVLQIASTLGRRAVERNQVDAQVVASWLYQQLVERGIALRPDDHEVRLVLLARRGSLEDMLSAARLTVQQHAAIGQGAYIRGIRALLTSERPDDAVRFANKAVEAAGSPSEELLFDYFRALTIGGTTADIREFIRVTESGGRLKALVERITGSPVTGSVPAEAAYLLGNFLSSNNKRAQAEAAYELALGYEPNHPWACNNLGYSLADRNEDLERAAELLERAHAALPAEPSITDSLGWLRYKQGILEDRPNPHGGATKGAIALLKEAVETDHGQQDPTILDHYGDALWLAGRAAEASHYWQLAGNYSSRKLRPARPAGATQDEAPTKAAAAEYREIIARTAQKRDLMGTGQWVPVAPQANNPRPSPPPTAAPATGEAPSPPAPGVGSSAGKSPSSAG